MMAVIAIVALLGTVVVLELIALAMELEPEPQPMRWCRKHGEYAGYDECPGCAGEWPGRRTA